MNSENNKKNPKKAISANKVLFPMIAVLAVLHLFIVYLIITVNSESTELSTSMQSSGIYIEEATSVLAGSSLLSETSGNYILMPIDEKGESNFGPLFAYANELQEDRRGPQILERFQNYPVSAEALDKLSVASDAAEQMKEAQLHAIALVASVYPLPEDIPLLETLPLPSLTAEELGMSKEQRLAEAHLLILNSNYATNKQLVSSNINECAGIIRMEMAQKSIVCSRNIAALRTGLWVATVVIILILAIMFTVLYRLVILPLKGDARLITTDKLLDEKTGLLEMRMLAEAYNALLKRRETLEEILRSAAETDVLTNLPNRYSFEQSLVEMADSHHAFSVVLFDVNFLKQTNDTFGHEAGDELIRSAADCIAECFGNAQRDNCFRIGGDEFAAVLQDVTQEQLSQFINHFLVAQKKRNISIAWGSASTDKIEETTFKKLIKQADLKMYEQKERMHREGSPVFVPGV